MRVAHEGSYIHEKHFVGKTSPSSANTISFSTTVNPGISTLGGLFSFDDFCVGLIRGEGLFEGGL